MNGVRDFFLESANLPLRPVRGLTLIGVVLAGTREGHKDFLDVGKGAALVAIIVT